MANALKGEVGFASGEDRYTLVFTIDALMVLEEHFDASVQQLGEMLGSNLRMAALRTIFGAGLLEHHPGMDDKAVGRLMNEIGLGEAAVLVAQAFTAAFGVGGKDEGAGPVGGKGPRTRAGTGARASTSG